MRREKIQERENILTDTFELEQHTNKHKINGMN